MYANNRSQDFIWGAVIGSAVGALTTMLFTTKKGRQIRQEITDKYHEFEDEVKNWSEDAKETIQSNVKKVAEKVKGDTK